MKKILLYIFCLLFPLTQCFSATSSETKMKKNQEVDYWSFDEKPSEELNTSIMTWGIVLFTCIAFLCGMVNPSTGNTPPAPAPSSGSGSDI